MEVPLHHAVQVAVFGDWIDAALNMWRAVCTAAWSWYVKGTLVVRAMLQVHRRRHWHIVSAYAIRQVTPPMPISSRDSDDSDDSNDSWETRDESVDVDLETLFAEDRREDRRRGEHREESAHSADTTQSADTAHSADSVQSTDFVALDHRFMKPGEEPETWMAHAWAQVPLSWGASWHLELRVQRGCQKRRVCLPASVAAHVHEVFRWPRDVHCRRPSGRTFVMAVTMIPRHLGAEPMDVTARFNKYVLLPGVPFRPIWLFPMDDADDLRARWSGIAVRSIDCLGRSSTETFEWDDTMVD